MAARALKVPAAPARGWLLAGLLAVAACGGEARSAADEESVPLLPVAALDQDAGEALAPAAPAPAATDVDVAEEAPPAPTQASPAPAVPAPAAPSRPGSVASSPRPAAPRPAAPRPAATPEPRPAAEPPAPRPAAQPVPAPAVLAAGSEVPLRLVGELSTERDAAGAPFEATVTEDVLAADGLVLVPAGARVRGHVLESEASPGPDRPARLTLAVDALEAHGRVLPLRATVVAAEQQAETRDSDTRTAAKVGAGAAAGAVLGQILGKDTRSTVKGAVAGAVAGGAVAAATRSGHAVMRDGARIVLRLDRALAVEP